MPRECRREVGRGQELVFKDAKSPAPQGDSEFSRREGVSFQALGPASMSQFYFQEHSRSW